MSKPHQGKTALITGSSRGIGKATALRLAEMGANIVINYVRDEGAAHQTLKTIEALGVQAIAVQANVGDPKDIDALIQTVNQKFAGIDILIHNAALGAFKPVHKLRMNQWDLSFEINTKAFLLLTQGVLPFMEKKGSGHILTVSSLGSHHYIPNYGAIGPSKAALESLVRYLAVELAPKGIHVNCVSGGLVDTDALKSFPDYEKFKETVLKQTPAGRIAAPDDIAKVIAFLTSNEADWICGQTLIADGGLSLI
ncbi:MAG: SDR family oxidoreductase [Candidatus Omnitrophica bacterium]|nr:SDR family oxidoreductase [Candidatus Omnitrophota bacterium]